MCGDWTACDLCLSPCVPSPSPALSALSWPTWTCEAAPEPGLAGGGRPPAGSSELAVGRSHWGRAVVCPPLPGGRWSSCYTGRSPQAQCYDSGAR